MSDWLRDHLTVAALVLVLLGVFLGLWAWRRPAPAAPGEGRPAEGMTAAPTGENGSKRPAGPSDATVPGAVAAPSPVAGGVPAPVDGEVGRATASTPKAGAPWRARPPADFSEADVAGCGRGVRVDLGRYAVQNGEEFTVRLLLSAPALESCTLVVRYDVGALAVVPQSVRPDGLAFRGGVEAYEAAADGKLVIIHAGTPGRKNVDAAEAAPVVVWRMKACRAGETHLEILPETSFTNGRGEEEQYEATGGDVRVR